MEIIWTKHALEPQLEWQRILEINGKRKIIQVSLINIGEMLNMKFKYDPEPDILSIGISDDPPVDALEEPGGIIISYGKQKNPVTIEFRNASVKRLIDRGEVNISFSPEKLPTVS